MRRAPHTPPLVALDLHDVVADGEPDASGFPGPGAARYELTRDRFRDHLDAIEAAVATRPLRFAVRRSSRPSRTVALLTHRCASRDSAYAAWNVRKAAKFAGGPTTLRVRQLLLAGAR